MKNKKTATLIAMIIAAVIIISLCIFVGLPMLKLAAEPEKFRLWVEEKGIWGPIIYCLVVIFQILIAFIPGEPLELVAGYTFGSLQGTLLCLIAEAIGSILVLFLVRKYGMQLLEIFFKKESIDKLKFLHTSKKGSVVFLFLFLIPGTPKDLLCYYAGLTDIPMPVLIIICTICRFPSIITSTVSGSAFGDKNYLFAILLFAGTLVISGIGVLLYNRLCLKKENKDTPKRTN